MKKSKYIGKYDYIAYYTKQPAFWFFSNAEVEAAIDAQMKLVTKSHNVQELDEDEDNEDYDGEQDYYELYKELKETNKDIDLNNPQIVEGCIIDKKSREFIKNKYKDISMVVDLEEGEYAKMKQEDIAVITKHLIENNENIIIFQPVFIAGYLITKPDALVKKGVCIDIIETKGTTTAKRHHFLDLYFQSKVMDKIEYLNDFYFTFALCLVRYCFANRYEVPLTITENFNTTKTVAFADKAITLDMKAFCKEALGFLRKIDGVYEYVDCPINITRLCSGDFSDLEQKREMSKTVKYVDMFIQRVEVLMESFEQVTQELYDIRTKMQTNGTGEIIGDIKPHANEKSFWKNSDLWLKVRTLYKYKGYKLFDYSGNIAKQTEDALITYKKSQDPMSYFKKEEYKAYFSEDADDITINRNGLLKMWSELKPKKVYFDFETINSPIRPIDHCLPFMQILTQCSVIIDDNDGTPVDQLKCNNIVIDPKHIEINQFKEVVDALYKGSDYSYIVYNANFERSRLNELKNYFDKNDDDYLEYCRKIDCINTNIYDIANYFVVNSDKYGRPVIIKELGGFYSIKKVLPYIMENYRAIYDMTGCKDYHDLIVVQNGKICQNETTKRFHNKLTDQEWAELEKNLKIYCENDVRAMIAVEYFIKELVKRVE